MAWPAIVLLVIQGILLSLFCFFAFYNYLYGIASLWKPRIRRTDPSGKTVAVVIVSFNEKHVLEDTVRACEALTYQNKIIVLADDSTDPETLAKSRRLAQSWGCEKISEHPFFQEVDRGNGKVEREPIEIWESPHFIFFHRPLNAGFKGGSLEAVCHFLKSRQIGWMYLLDADWHPQRDALEQTLAVLEADTNAAFVQTKRISSRKGMNLFQKYVAIYEEGCYYADFEGRQVLGHPILFSGCCTLFRLEAVAAVGGFTPGHLTEDLDLTDRFWIHGWKGIYLGEVVNHGEVPFSYEHFRRQQERWAAGSARALRDFFLPILTTRKLSSIEKLSAIRQNAYFTSTLLTGFALLVGMLTVLWLSVAWNSYAVEYYLYVMGLFRIPILFVIYGCILANFIEPLVMIFVKKRSFREALHLPMSFWYTWSNLYAYIVGNIKGLFGVKFDWFCTPKFRRSGVERFQRIPLTIRVVNLCTCAAFLCLYFTEGWMFGWFDEFALLWLPAFLLGSME